MSTWFERTTSATILFLIFFTPLAFGSVHPWAFAFMEAAIFFVVAAWMGRVILAQGQEYRARSKEQSPDIRSQWSEVRSPFALGSRRWATRLAVPVILFIGLVLFQLVPLPPSLLRALSPSTYELYQKSLRGWPAETPYEDLATFQNGSSRSESSAWILLPTVQEVEKGAQVPFTTNETNGDSNSSGSRRSSLWLPLSVAPPLTRPDLLKVGAYGLLFFLVLLYPFSGSQQAQSWSDPRSVEVNFLRAVLIAVLLSGLLVATIGIAQAFTWNGKILWFFESYDPTLPGPGQIARASGPFVNPAQFANYLTLVFFIALAGAFFPSFIFPREAEQGCRILCAVAVLVIFSAILLSLSRGAWIGFAAGSVFFVSAVLCSAREKRSSFIPRFGKVRTRLFVLAVCILLLMSLFFVGAEGRSQLEGRLADAVTQGTGLYGRVSLWLDTLHMSWDFPLFGIGFGAWPDLFPHYRRIPWSPVFFREAHNDYIELLAETGILGFSLVALFFWRCGRMLLSALPKRFPRVFPLYVAILSGLVSMAVHEFFDFSLQIPANAFLFVVLLATTLRMRNLLAMEGDSHVTTTSVSARRRHFPSSYIPPLLACACLVLIFVALRQERTPYPYNLKEPTSIAEARDMILAHPARASGHFYLFQHAKLKASPSWLTRELEITVWLAPTNPYARDLYAALLLQQRRRQQGLEEMNRSVFYSPSLQTHVYLHPRILPWLSPDEQAAVENGFQRAVAQGYPDALGHLVAFYEWLQRYVDAARLYENEALKIKDSKGKSVLLLKAGYFYAMGKDETKADTLLRQVISANPLDPTPYQYLVNFVHVPKNNLIAARSVIDEGIGNGVDPVTLYLSLAEVAAKTGNRTEEKSALVEAIKLRPSSLDLHYRLGILSLQENDFDRSAFYLAKATKLNPQSAEAFFYLAAAEEGRYRFFAAEQAYMRAVELAPNEPHYRERHEALKRRISENQKSGIARSK